MMSLYLICVRIRPWPVLLFVFAFWFLLSFSADSYYAGEQQFINADSNYPAITYKYDRQEDLRKYCQSVLATASDLKPDDNRFYRIQNELSFINGDWDQSPGMTPLLPFSHVHNNTYRNRSIEYPSMASPIPHAPSKLASFWITHVDRHKNSKNSINVSGLLLLGITSYLDGSFSRRPYSLNPEFRTGPGHSEISILFQGIYVESGQNKNERALCLLGNAMLPSRQLDSSEPGSLNDQPSLLQDDQILLVLHYPTTLSLMNMVIRGELKSLNTKDSSKYFSDTHIISHLNFPLSSNYLPSNVAVAKACNPYSPGDSCKTAYTDVYKQKDFCSLLEQLSTGQAFTIVPNWKCNGTDEYCRRLGPFLGDRQINATDGSFKGVGLLMQDVRCEKTTLNDGVTSAKVIAIFRAVSEFENVFYASSRSGLSNMTVVAEGIWSSSSGQLCMIACLGIIKSEEDCTSRACLYIPLSFSIKQRSILVGTFSSLNQSGEPYFPLSFEKLVQPNELWQFQNAKFQYKYSKIEEAGSVLEKDQPFNFGNIIKKSLLKFPKLENEETYMTSIYILSENLRFHTSAMPDPTPGSRFTRIDIQMDIVSLGPMLGLDGETKIASNEDEDVPYITKTEDVPYIIKTEFTERQILLNVSAQLTISGKPYSNLSVIFLEGIYDPHVGKMYLIGCRDVRASWEILHESMDLEAGLDCQVEVVVSYPPTTARWFMNPTAKISVSSKRNEDDPLHFPEFKVQTVPLLYRTQREDILSHRGVEAILKILTLTMTVTFIFSQLIYMRQSSDFVPFISLMMLGVQVLGYSLHLITGAEAILGGMTSKSSSYENSSYVLEKSYWLKLIDYCIKLLVLVCFLLVLRLCQRVWKSRIRLLSRTPLEPNCVPSDRRVMIITFMIHLVGYSTVLFLHTSNSNPKPISYERYMDPSGNLHKAHEWDAQLEEYLGLVQDFFLLPQIIGNFIWQIHCKPLRKLYYIGITAVRVLPHVYNHARDPIPNPYFSEDNEFVNPNLDFYSKFGDIFIPVMAVILAVIVYIQQTWSYENMSQTLRIGQFRFLPLVSRAYQRLPSKTTEAELVSCTGENSDHEERHANDE